MDRETLRPAAIRAARWPPESRTLFRAKRVSSARFDATNGPDPRFSVLVRRTGNLGSKSSMPGKDSGRAESSLAESAGRRQALRELLAETARAYPSRPQDGPTATPGPSVRPSRWSNGLTSSVVVRVSTQASGTSVVLPPRDRRCPVPADLARAAWPTPRSCRSVAVPPAARVRLVSHQSLRSFLPLTRRVLPAKLAVEASPDRAGEH